MTPCRTGELRGCVFLRALTPVCVRPDGLYRVAATCLPLYLLLEVTFQNEHERNRTVCVASPRPAIFTPITPNF